MTLAPVGINQTSKGNSAQAGAFTAFNSPVAYQTTQPDELIKKGDTKKKILMGAGILAATVAATAGLVLLAKNGKLGDGAKEFVNKIFKPKNIQLKPLVENMNIATKELEEQGDGFTGIYNAMHRASEGKVRNPKNIFGDWKARIDNNDALVKEKPLGKFLHGIFDDIDPEVITKEQAQSKAKDLLAGLKELGLKRDELTELIIDGDTYRRYFTESGEIITAGNKVKVLFPCWEVNSKVIEKGSVDLFT